jgi:hypothetical protein
LPLKNRSCLVAQWRAGLQLEIDAEEAAGKLCMAGSDTG